LPTELLLGRKTFEIFASYWPKHEDEWPGINTATKYVASNTLSKHDWQNTVFRQGDVGMQIEKLKKQDGPNLQVHGSSNLIQTLLKHLLVDSLWLKVFPINFGGANDCLQKARFRQLSNYRTAGFRLPKSSSPIMSVPVR
jgi:dihydrofolate reductase